MSLVINFHALIKKVPILKNIIYFLFRVFRVFFWKLRGSVYSFDNPPKELFKELCHIIELKQFSNSSIVEFGCNSGALLFALAKKFPLITYIGVDLNIKAISLAKNLATTKNIKIDFINADIRKFQFVQGAEIIITSATLIYLNSNELMDFFKKSLPFVKNLMILNEIMSKTGFLFKSHFFAHPYKKIFEEPLFKNFEFEFLPANIPAWEREDTTGAIIKLIRK